MLSHFSHVWLFATLWTIAHQAPLSMGFSKQEYWSGLPFPSPGDLPNLGIEPGSPALRADSLLAEPPGKHIKKQRHHFANKGSNCQSYDFSCSHVWMWDWSIKKAERRRIDAFELWCWRRLLRVPWITRRSNQSILKEISPEYPLEELMLTLKLQYFDHLMRRTDSFEKTLMLGKIEGGRRRGWQRMRWWIAWLPQWKWVWVNSRNWSWTGKPGVLQFMG